MPDVFLTMAVRPRPALVLVSRLPPGEATTLLGNRRAVYGTEPPWSAVIHD
jgi:hypothetical protein